MMGDGRLGQSNMKDSIYRIFQSIGRQPPRPTWLAVRPPFDRDGSHAAASWMSDTTTKTRGSLVTGSAVDCWRSGLFEFVRSVH